MTAKSILTQYKREQDQLISDLFSLAIIAERTKSNKKRKSAKLKAVHVRRKLFSPQPY